MQRSHGPQLLLFDGSHKRTGEIYALLESRGLNPEYCDIQRPPEPRRLATADVIAFILDSESCTDLAAQIAALFQQVQEAQVATIVWGAPDELRPDSGPIFDWAAPDVGLEEIVGRLTSLAHFGPIVKRLDRELQHLQRIGKQLNRYFSDVDKEMRLAGRLQQSFLPDAASNFPPLRFARLYRPAAWVSGDIFDVFPIDAQHVGMFIADAMGHGTAAGLMTMFLRRALVPTHHDGHPASPLTPTQAMTALHDDLENQDLPYSQFVTAAYAVVDTQSLSIRVARGGHPYPMWINAAGEIGELRPEGPLLGVAGIDPDFTEVHAQLSVGDKVILFTDGIEEVLVESRDPDSGEPVFTGCMRDWAKLDLDSFIAALADHVENLEGSLNPADDVTVLAFEVGDSSPGAAR